MTPDESAVAVDQDPVLDAIESGDAHDNLLGYMKEDETAEEALERLLFALPSFTSLECRKCGRELTPLDKNEWIAWRLPVEDTEYQRTDLYCGLACLTESIDGQLHVPITEVDDNV